MQITGIIPHKKNKGILSVYVDEEYLFSIQEEDFFKLGLYEGSDIDEDQIRNIKTVVNYAAAKSKAVYFLALKLRTEKELFEKVKSFGFDEELTQNVLDELKSMGYLNDKLYALKYIHDRTKLKPQAQKMLRYDLLQKGVPADIIDEVLSGFELDECAVAVRLIKRKYGKYDITDESIYRKVVDFLRRRGFSSSIIQNAIDELVNNERD